MSEMPAEPTDEVIALKLSTAVERLEITIPEYDKVVDAMHESTEAKAQAPIPMDHTINVLDHGLVRLVSYTQPAVQEVEVRHLEQRLADGTVVKPAGTSMMAADYSDWTGDLEIVRNARVSYDAAWRAGEDDDKDAKLVNYLLKNRHTSPFEAMVFTFEIKAPIFVLRQWHRHRTWSYNEVSARYAELPEEFYVPELDQITTQSTSNKQMRTAEQHKDAGQERPHRSQ